MLHLQKIKSNKTHLGTMNILVERLRNVYYYMIQDCVYYNQTNENIHQTWNMVEVNGFVQFQDNVADCKDEPITDL